MVVLRGWEVQDPAAHRPCVPPLRRRRRGDTGVLGRCVVRVVESIDVDDES
jgi:hypothetical protein